MLDKLKKAKIVGTPLIRINTADNIATAARITQVYTDVARFKDEKDADFKVRVEAAKKTQSSFRCPVLTWNGVDGLAGSNPMGEQALLKLLGGQDQSVTQSALTMLQMALGLPGVKKDENNKVKVGGAILVMFNPQLFMDSQSASLIVQQTANMRDEYKADQRSLIWVGQDIKLPPELQQDFLCLDEPLPNDEQLTDIVVQSHGLIGLKPTQEVIAKAVTALRGLAAFPAEQATAESLTETGVDLPGLWVRKYAKIDEIDGLNVERGSETFDSIGGNSQIKKLGRLIMNSKNPPRVCVRIEEIEKSMAGSNNAIDGASGDALQVILTEMEDRKYKGLVAVGHSGTGKSLFAKSLANSFGIPAMRFDPGAAKGKGLVGQAENAIRAVFKAINAMAGDGGAFFVASSNGLGAMKPELLTRFRYGIWMFDMPTEGEELDSIWAINLKQYGLDQKMKRPTDIQFTGRDIRNMCELASDLSITLDEALNYINPISVSNPQAIKSLQESANGKYLSASYHGVYRLPTRESKPVRSISLGG